MSKGLKYISPISIDLGAGATGVYMAHYKEGDSIENIEKQGAVYKLSKKGKSMPYTILMADRTASRHQRRGYDRKQMAKRLFKLVWENELKLSWDNDVQQTISFLLNRRGFTFVTEDYDERILGVFPDEAYKVLPAELQKEINKVNISNNAIHDISVCVTEWSRDEHKLKSVYSMFEEKTKKIDKELVVLSRLKKLIEYCDKRIRGEQIPPESKKGNSIKLSQLSKWILNEFLERGVKGLDAVEKPQNSNAVDMVKFLNSITKNQCSMISGSMDKEKVAGDLKNAKASIWNFKIHKFEMEKEQNSGNFDNVRENENFIKAHIKHMSYAIYLLKSELESGGRYRSKYFEEVANVLQYEPHTHGYLKRFCNNLRNGNFINPNNNSPLIEENIVNLIGNISNFELKPLRKYFNDKQHISGDKWFPDTLEKIFKKWIFKEWRVSEKNKDKAQGKEFSYIELKNKYNGSNGNIVQFWLSINPRLTIPPYQDNNNRRPPRCQSLVLNVPFLEKKYPQWLNWLADIKALPDYKYTAEYVKQLRRIKSGKNKGYFYDNPKLSGEIVVDSGKRTTSQLDARVMQFILDKTKDTDHLKLNEIYSYTKKLRQIAGKSGYSEKNEKDKKNYTTKLGKCIENSQLPDNLKSKPDHNNIDIFVSGSFFHFICAYYRDRQRARDGRIFIHPEYKRSPKGFARTNRYDDKTSLLTYCNHMPRQKRHQILYDVCSVLQVGTNELRNLMAGDDEERIISWLEENSSGLKSNSAAAAKYQKDLRGALKSQINIVYSAVYNYCKQHNKTEEDMNKTDKKKVIDSIKEYVNDASKFYASCEKMRDIYINLIESTKCIPEEQIEQIKNSVSKNRAIPVYELAKLHNIIYKDRNGNSKTCAVCNLDNNMRTTKILFEEDFVAQAQRLPAIETRVIDGAVRKLAHIVGRKIAVHKWEHIEELLKSGSKITIPIMTESNSFEFEPSLRNLKGKKKRTEEKSASKEDRIKTFSGGVSAYSGASLTGGKFNGDLEEIDHIIPRSSKKYGLLNDEANLICVTKKDNKDKGKTLYSLNKLHDKYKRKIFNTIDNKKIEEWITNTIDNGERKDFKFGKYNSFINLSPDEQVAFRHALFLPEGNDLRDKVINAIDNRNRTFVNGTQRYFAEVIASELYKKALASKTEDNLRFDYFTYEAAPSSKGDGVYENRKELLEYRKRLHEYDKQDGVSQFDYSHLIDAQVLFCIALENHQDDGTFKINLAGRGLWSKVSSAGELLPRKESNPHGAELYDLVDVGDSNFNTVNLERLLPGPENKNANNRPLFSENSVAMHFLKLLEIIDAGSDKPHYLSGFLSLRELRNSIDEKNMDTYSPYAKKCSDKEAQQYLDLYKSRFPSRANPDVSVVLQDYGKHKTTVKLYSLDKTAVFDYLIDNFNTAIGEDEIKNLLQSKEAEEIYNAIKKLQYFTKRKNVIVDNNLYAVKTGDKKCCGLINPSIDNAWNDLYRDVENISSDELFDKVKDCLMGTSNNKHDHQKVRKICSLPISDAKGILIRKFNWKKEKVYQCRPLSNDFSFTINCMTMGDKLSNIYRNSNMFISGESFNKYMRMLQNINYEYAIDANRYYARSIPQDFEKFITRAENRRTDAARPRLRFTLNRDNRMDFESFKQFMYSLQSRALTECNKVWDTINAIKDINDINALLDGDSLIGTDKDKKSLRSALREFSNLYSDSQNKSVLEYNSPNAEFEVLSETSGNC